MTSGEADGEAMLSGDKSPFASKGVWGGVMAILSALLPLLGPALGLDAPAQAEVIGVASSLGAAIGGAIAIWGRIAARRVVSARGIGSG